jgi:pilus assembly protein CpaD
LQRLWPPAVSIALENGLQKLDVFLVGNSGRLDPRQQRDVQHFAAAWRARGNGPIIALLPSGNGQEAQANATLDAIRYALARAHIGGSISVGRYPVVDPHLAAPVQLSFATLVAHVHRCGEWPEDLASGSSTETFSNRTYWNFGCATQKTLAAQIDDPRDLVRPRVEDPADVAMRSRAITNIRQGVDPGTKWGQ